MENPQEHYHHIIRLHDSVYSLPGEIPYKKLKIQLTNQNSFTQGTANLQSSINATDGLGVISLSAIYAALVISCIFLPTLLIKRLTVKWTLVFSMLCYAPYIAFQLFPK